MLFVKNWKQNIIYFVIIILIAYLFGLVLVSIIDKRLSKINLTIPKQNVVIKLEKNMSSDNKYTINQNKKNINISKNIKTKPKFDKEFYSMQDNIEGFSNLKTNEICKKYEPLDSTIFYNNKFKACCKNHKHCKLGNAECNYGPTNYADPLDMSVTDKKLFMLSYPNNMTLQDYVNWLQCFVGKEDELSYNHLVNLEKLLEGRELKYQEGVLPPPAKVSPPLTSQEYFDRLYNEDGEINLAAPLNSTRGALMAANYGDYSEFWQNNQQYGTSGKIFNKKNLAKKKFVKTVDNYIRPRLSS